MEREKRKYPRISLSLKVFYRVKQPFTAVMLVDDREIEAEMLDLSCLGIALLSHWSIPVGTKVDLKFSLIDMSKPGVFAAHGPIQALGQVRNNTLLKGKRRLGLEFLEISNKDRVIINNFIQTILKSGPII